jgi:hypothetical protein
VLTPSNQKIYEALISLPPENSGYVSLPLFHGNPLIAVGRDHNGQSVVLTPGAAGRSLRKEGIEFLSETNVRDVHSGATLPAVALLKCNFAQLSEDQRNAYSSAIVGIFKLVHTDHVAEAHSAMRGLVDLVSRDLLRPLTTQEVAGLFGEFLVIHMSSDPCQMVRFWRNATDSPQDFSVDQYRLEVKSTTKPIREHEISTSQLSTSAVSHLASLQLSKVSSGVSLASLYKMIVTGLTEEPAKDRFERIVSRTTTCPIELLDETHFDLVSSIQSLQLWDFDAIPKVQLDKNVIWAHWRFLLSGEPPKLRQYSPLVNLLLGSN